MNNKIMKSSLDVKSLTTNDIEGLILHNERIKVQFKNEGDIDGVNKNFMMKNVYIVSGRNIRQYERMIETKYRIIGGLQKRTAKYSAFVVHAGNIDNQLETEKAISFLTDTAKYLSKYGEIMSAVIHMDEATPHLHLITSNLREVDQCNAYWSAKQAFGLAGKTKAEVRDATSKMHQDFWINVSSKYGFAQPDKNSMVIGFKKQGDYILDKLNKQRQDQERRILEIAEKYHTIVDKIVRITESNIALMRDRLAAKGSSSNVVLSNEVSKASIKLEEFKLGHGEEYFETNSADVASIVEQVEKLKGNKIFDDMVFDNPYAEIEEPEH